jgi:hypothetical protein
LAYCYPSLIVFDLSNSLIVNDSMGAYWFIDRVIGIIQ